MKAGFDPEMGLKLFSKMRDRLWLKLDLSPDCLAEQRGLKVPRDLQACWCKLRTVGRVLHPAKRQGDASGGAVRCRAVFFTTENAEARRI